MKNNHGVFVSVSQSVSTISLVKYNVVPYFTRNSNISEKVVNLMCLGEVLELQVADIDYLQFNDKKNFRNNKYK